MMLSEVRATTEVQLSLRSADRRADASCAAAARGFGLQKVLPGGGETGGHGWFLRCRVSPRRRPAKTPTREDGVCNGGTVAVTSATEVGVAVTVAVAAAVAVTVAETVTVAVGVTRSGVHFAYSVMSPVMLSAKFHSAVRPSSVYQPPKV